MINKYGTVLIFLLLGACTQAPEVSVNSLGETQNVIYGDNDIAEEKDNTVNSSASVVLMNKKKFEEFQRGIEPDTVKEVVGLDELDWKDQPSLGFCSGVVLKDDLILTAGHCVLNTKCEDMVVVSDFDTIGAQYRALQSFECQKIEGSEARLGLMDYAFIRLKKMMKVAPVQISKSSLRLKDSVYSIGYPLGAPKKRSLGKIRFIDYYGNYRVSLDAFVGQSGSPVFDSKTDELIGVLSSGEADGTDSAGNMKVKYCPDEDCSGENIIAIQNILKKFPTGL